MLCTGFASTSSGTPPCVFLYYHTMKKSINNSIKAFAMAAIATMFSMSITSCGDDDDVLPDTQKVEEPETYGLVVNEMSMEVVSSCEVYPDRSVLIKDNHMEIVGGKTEVRKGDSFSVKFNLFNSYVVKSVKVNGVDMTSNVKDNGLTVDVNNDIVNGKDDITIDAVYDMNLTFKVTAEFTNNEKTEVKYHITPSVEGVMYFGHAVKHSAWVNTNILGDNDIVNVDAISNKFLTSELKFGSATVTRSYAVADDYILIVCRLNKDNEVIGDVLVYHMNDLLGIK